MRVSEVAVSNYRSIGPQTRFELNDLTTLIGPNNEGKSNLLRALALGLRVIRAWGSLSEDLAKTGELSGHRVSLIYSSFLPHRRADPNQDIDFDWGKDYPLGKQTAKSPRPTIIRLTFHLEDGEKSAFKEEVGLNNNSELPIELRFSRSSTSLHMVKQGPSSSSYADKAGLIAKFVSERISYVLVPAVRTMDQAMSLLNKLASIRLDDLSRSKDYQEALHAVNDLRDAAVRGVQDDLRESISTYLPSVSQVTIETRDVRQSAAIGRVIVDDGSATPLEQKGDGVKSLFALALIQYLAKARTRNPGDNLILLVDEPEAHLHSRSVHDLQALFVKISRTQQVVVATHNPIFVNREHVNGNVLVQRNSASAARTIKRIREAMGIALQDNLDSAEIVVLVEGVTDVRVLSAVLRRLSTSAARDLDVGRVVLKAVTGTGKMRSSIARERSTACRIVVVLDNDSAGSEEAKRLCDEGVIDPRSVFVFRDGQRRSSELEDLIRPEVYIDALSESFGRVFTESHFASVKRKWADNLKVAAESLAVAGDPEDVLKQAKICVSRAVESFDGEPMKKSARPGLEALERSIWSPVE